ncbi:hypothetical protein ACERK3_16120 [Phycisphaerales bacterium AB-hyl4]|uniref:DUF4013 domain-containing protein n=1 Tax=Natronomicrosphaera hydrolytica TaxID=3242702 RepID=A0ABV4U951_9BACT
MSEYDTRVRVDRVDWYAVLPWLALLRTAAMALHPAKVVLALALVALLYAGGLALDVVWGAAVPDGAVQRYQVMSGEQYSRWMEAYREAAADDRAGEARGVFETTVAQQRSAFRRLLNSAVTLELGVGDFLMGRGSASRGLMGPMVEMLVTVPTWLIRTQPTFVLLYLLWAFLVTAILGGAIARLAALHACLNRRGSLVGAVRFVAARYPWFFLAPLTPVLLVVLIGVGMMIVGVLFNLPGLDVVGALLYGAMLMCGLVAALLVVGLATAGHLLLPAMAVEGTDAFDALSRTYNYTLGRPLHFLFYSLVSIVYGAAMYLVISLVLLLTLWLTWAFASQLVFTTVGDTGVNRFDALLAPPLANELVTGRPDVEVGVLSTMASVVMRGWVTLLAALLPAFAVSFYFCASTWIYLLLRRATDGTGFDDVFIAGELDGDTLGDAATMPPEKVEPGT